MASQSSTIKFGGKGTGPGKFNTPRGVLVSYDNEIFVSDMGNRRVQVFNMEGVFLREFPTVVPKTAHVMKPYDITIDGSGHLWVLGRDGAAEFVVQYNKEGKTQESDGQPTNKFSLPPSGRARGIGLDRSRQHILVTGGDASSAVVKILEHDGSLVREFGQDGVLKHPRDVTVNKDGNILVLDKDPKFVHVYDKEGKLQNSFGIPGTGDGQMKAPRNICHDNAGNIVVADWGNRRVEMFTSKGEHMRHVGIRDGMGQVHGVAIAPDGKVVVTDWVNHEVTILPNDEDVSYPIREKTSTGTSLIKFGGRGSGPGKFVTPRGVLVSYDNEIFVTDMGNKRVQVFDMEGVFRREFPTVVPKTDTVMKPYDITIDGGGQLWVLGREGSAEFVVQYTKEGSTIVSNGQPTNKFSLPPDGRARGIGLDRRRQHILVTGGDGSGAIVKVLEHDGSLVREFGQDGELAHPRDLTVNKDGTILVLDRDPEFVHFYDETGKLLSSFGSPGTGDGQMKHPRNICHDNTGNIVVADWGNRRIEMFTPEGKHMHHVGIKDGMGEVHGIAVAPDGKVVLSDWVNDTVTILQNSEAV
ncbi:uncharacterized protein LOC144883161 [Branchiostoma floridae x Branchiostoma japonicum]